MFAGCGKVYVKERNLGAGGSKSPGGGGADGAGRSGDGGDLSGERQFLARAELSLFERPIFAIEHIGLGDRLEAADGVGVTHAFDPGLGNVGRDDRSPFGAAEPEQPQARHQDDAGQGIEFALDSANAFVVAFEVPMIPDRKSVSASACGARKFIKAVTL